MVYHTLPYTLYDKAWNTIAWFMMIYHGTLWYIFIRVGIFQIWITFYIGGAGGTCITNTIWLIGVQYAHACRAVNSSQQAQSLPQQTSSSPSIIGRTD